jgi:hypothetical protein
MTALLRTTPVIDEETKQTYVGLYMLKKLDLEPRDGGLELPAVFPSELAPVEDVVHQLAVEDRVRLHPRHNRWEMTPSGLAYLAEHIDEAEALIDEFDDLELDEAIAELKARNLDVLRARFLWGWFDGEFDDLVLFQQRRGVRPVETLWAYYLTSDAFFEELAKDLAAPT